MGSQTVGHDWATDPQQPNRNEKTVEWGGCLLNGGRSKHLLFSTHIEWNELRTQTNRTICLRIWQLASHLPPDKVICILLKQVTGVPLIQHQVFPQWQPLNHASFFIIRVTENPRPCWHWDTGVALNSGLLFGTNNTMHIPRCTPPSCSASVEPFTKTISWSRTTHYFLPHAVYCQLPFNHGKHTTNSSKS